ncbi:hypothetical protein FisN_11Lh108 [Fistulifera solaris]|uniref:Uncharacterized protein n=1 Tax=Fistulifera solaris TaxID=1519565 RepID=A0A1Z5J7D2_FISSO|nr:hypothetical protein FisN_11Lh108 [Fistulifera solaris]|eukprot:GAX09907.1 hypothetical protein FisN_11Lh108 [Fistulifera solaris]
MGNDDEYEDYSIQDLEYVCDLSPREDRLSRRRAFSEGNMVGLPIRGTEEKSLGRARIWSSGGASFPFLDPRSPKKERKFHSKRGLLRRYSRKPSEPGEAYQIAEEDLLNEKLTKPSPAGERHLISRLSLSSYNQSSTNVEDDLENPTRFSSNEPTPAQIQPSHSLVGLSSPTSEMYDDDDSSHPADWSTERNGRTPPSLWGIPLPTWLAKKRPSWNRLAACVVMKAPCFLCFPLSQTTDRAIVQRLNILCAIFAFFQLFSAVMLFVYLTADIAEHDVLEYDSTGNLRGPDSTPADIEVLSHVWNINGAVFTMGSIAFLLLVMTIVIVPVVRSVNLKGAIRYLWLLLWIIPIQIYSVIGLFDYFRVTRVWVKHWWRDESLATFRRAFCKPSSSYNTLCAAPEVENVTSWCLVNFNVTNCGEIRADAQDKFDKFMIAYYYGNAIWGIVLVLLLLLVVRILESIISRPLVQKSRESNVPAWFSLPILGCIGNGLLFVFSSSSELVNQADRSSTFWVGLLFVAAGGLFFLAAILGWFISSYTILNTRDKRYKMLAVNFFLIIIAVVFILLIWIVGGSIAFSISLVENPLSEEARGNIACFLDQANTCTGCDQDPSDSIRCPDNAIRL